MTNQTAKKPEQEKCCQGCRRFKPVSQMTKKKIRGYDGVRRAILRCNPCWEVRGQ